MNGFLTAVLCAFSGRRPAGCARRKLVEELAAFLGRTPFALPITSRKFSAVDLPNLPLALSKHCRERPWLVPPDYGGKGDRPHVAAAVGAIRPFVDRERGGQPARGSAQQFHVQLVRLRNELGHGSVTTARRALSGPLLAGLEELLSEWRYLADAELWLILGGADGASSGSAQAIRYVGETPRDAAPPETCRGCKPADSFPRFCIRPAAEWLPCFTVHPLLVYLPPSTEPLFVNGERNQSWSMLDHGAGRTRRVSHLTEDFGELFGDRGDLGARLPRHNLALSPNPHFVRREQDLAELHEFLVNSDDGAVAVTGIGGRGKTQLQSSTPSTTPPTIPATFSG